MFKKTNPPDIIISWCFLDYLVCISLCLSFLIVSLKKRLAQKLRIIILLRFGQATFKFSFGKLEHRVFIFLDFILGILESWNQKL